MENTSEQDSASEVFCRVSVEAVAFPYILRRKTVAFLTIFGIINLYAAYGHFARDIAVAKNRMKYRSHG